MSNHALRAGVYRLVTDKLSREVPSPYKKSRYRVINGKEKWILQKGNKESVLRCLSRQDAVVVEGDLYILEVAGLQSRNFLKMGEASRLSKKGKSLTARHFSFGFGHSWL